MKKKIFVLVTCLVLVFVFFVNQIYALDIVHILNSSNDGPDCRICNRIESAILFLSILNIYIITSKILSLMGIIRNKKYIFYNEKVFQTLIELKVQLNL